MKRAKPRQASLFRDSGEIRKASGDLADLLTSEEGGHQHGISVRLYEGEVSVSMSYASGPEDEAGHYHPIVKEPDGDGYVLGVVAGHAHVVNQEDMNRAVLALLSPTTKTSKEGDQVMTDETKKAEGNEPMVEDLQKQLDRANSIVALGSEERAYFDTLKGETAQDAFLAKSADERQAEVETVAKAKQDADPVLYTTADGVELRKSVGAALIAMAKSNDAIRKENEALRQQRDRDALEKRAEEEFSHLPGDVKTRASMLKAVEGIPDEAQREAALNALKAQNDALAKAFETHGVGGQPAQGSADSELNQLAKDLAEKENTSFEKAYAQVLGTEQGKKLYAETVN